MVWQITPVSEPAVIYQCHRLIVVDSPRNEHIRHVLILAKKWQMEKNLNWLGIGSHDDYFADTAIEGLGCLIGALLGLFVVGGLLDEVEKRDGEIGVGEGEGLFGHVCLICLLFFGLEELVRFFRSR